MSKIRESAVEKVVCGFGEANGITMQKQSGPGDRGKTDRLCMRKGIAAFLEIKRPGEKPTALQMRYIRKRREDGFEADWCDNAADGIAFLKRVFNV